MGKIGGWMLLGAMLVSSGGAEGPQTKTPDLAGLAQEAGGQVFNRTVSVTQENGRAVARLDARPGDGGVLLDGLLLSEGTIEVDLKGKNVPQQSFLGIAFHVVDWTTLEAVYFRPVSNHRQSRWLDYVNRPRRLSQLAAHERLG